MKTVINRRFLIGLIVCSLLFGAAIHGLHAIQISRQSSFLLEEAHRAQTEKQFELALNRFQQYTKLAPDDNDALAEFGLLLADRHAAKAAAFTLEKVLRAQPNRHDVRRRLAMVEMGIGQWGDAKVHLELLKAKLPGDPEVRDLLGVCQAAGGDYGAAAVSLRESIDRNPSRIDTYAHLAEVKRQLKLPDEADTWMGKLVSANPKSGRAHLLAGRYLAGIGRDEQAREETEKALELAPDDTEALLLAAALASAKPPYDKARDYAQRAVDSAPASAVGYIALARIEALAGDRKKAIACLETGEEKTHSSDAALLWELGRLQIAAAELPRARETVDRLHKLPANERLEPLIGYLEARLELASHHWPAAIQRFEQVAPELSRSPDLLKEVRIHVAECHEKLGNTELQLAAYREAARVDPMWAPARLGVAATLLSLGKFDEALEEYRQISRLDSMSGAGSIGLARLLIMKNLTASTAEPDGKTADIWKEVDAILKQLAEKNPDAIGVTLLQAESLVGQKRGAEAEELLQAARAKAPDKIELWSGLVGLARHDQQWDRVDKLLREARKQFGDQVWLRLTEGSSLVSRYQQQAAPKLKALGAETSSFSGDDLLRLFRGLAILSLQAGDAEQAKGFARRAGQADPKNLELRELLFELALMTNDAAGVEAVLKEIRELEEGEGPFWHYGQAALCLLTKPGGPALDEATFQHQLDAAVQHLDAARHLRPGWTRVMLLTARIQDRQGQSGAALQNYLEAIDLGEHNAEAVRRTIELLNSRQRYAEADQILRRLEQQPTMISNDLERLASEVSARLENLDRALAIATKVAADSQEWRDHVWLGQLQGLLGRRAQAASRLDEAKGDLADAEKSLNKAVQLKPDAAETWVALVRFYAANDRKPEAESTIRLAERKLPAETSALAMAVCYEAVGNAAEATKQFESVLTKNAKDPFVVRRAAEFFMRSGRLADAEMQLRTIVSGHVAAKAEDVVWARRALASVLRASGSYPKIQQALMLIAQNKPATPDDQKERALSLAVCPQLERRREAIQILEGLLSSQSDTTDIRMVLAQLYLAEKNWPQALKQWRSLATDHEREPRYTALFTARLLERRETAEAELWIQRLEQIAPADFSTASLKAQALVQRNQVEKAIQTLRAYCDHSAAEPSGQTAGRAARLGQVAAALESLARGTAGTDATAAATNLLAEAETLYRELVKLEPRQSLALASFLARRARFDEALSIMEEESPTAAAGAMAKASSDLFAGGVAMPPQLLRLEQLLLASAEKHGRSPVVLLTLGELRMRRERFDEAIEIYREVLKSDKDNAAALNNLALLLALEKKDLNDSLRLVERAIELAGPAPALLDSRASVYLALGKPQEALADLEQVVSEEPRPNRQFHRALACFQLGQSQAAAQALDEARKLGLKPEDLNSLERPVYEDLVAKLQRRGG
jgi:tetratricopeptide (TPR) repeat protein